MTRIDPLVSGIASARKYTESLLDSLQPDDWFRQPAEGVTHVAWQVGHLAAAEYHLCMVRIRGRRESDAEVIPEPFLGLFGRSSTPQPDPAVYPAPEEIRGVLDRVHARALEELTTLDESVLDEPVEPAHPMFSTKGGALAFFPQHEMLHAGQIGLLRRLFGSTPLR